MAALVPAGAPVSVLIDHGLAEEVVEKLIQAGVGTVEKLGNMTPEELETIPEVGPETVQKILISVNSYYAQFEPPAEAPEETVPADLPAETETAEAALEQPAGLPIETLAEVSSDGSESTDAKVESDTIKNSEEVG